MNLVRINDSPQFVWAIDERTTVDLIKFLAERGTKIPYTDREGLKTKGNVIDTEV